MKNKKCEKQLPFIYTYTINCAVLSGDNFSWYCRLYIGDKPKAGKL